MKYSKSETTSMSKHGIDLTLFPDHCPNAEIAVVNVEKGHFQEFYHKSSWFLYYIQTGSGRFFLDGVETKAESGDLVAVPPMTKIYYFGKMSMILVTSPVWNEENEVHVRFIDESEAT